MEKPLHTCHHHHCQQEALQKAEDVCARLGARFTNHRRRVLEIIWQGHKALTAAEIMEKLGNKQPPITYRALDFLKDAGLVHQITSLNAYAGCPHPTHTGHVAQIMVCTQCREVVEMEPLYDLSEIHKKGEEMGFHPTQTHIEVLGLCAACSQEKGLS